MSKLSFPKSMLAGFVPLVAGIAIHSQAHANASIPYDHNMPPASSTMGLHNFPEGQYFRVPSINGKPSYEVMRSQNCEKNQITRLVIKTTAIADALGSNSLADVQTLVVCTINEDQSAKLSDALGYSVPQFENMPFYLVLGSQSSATGKPLTGDVAIALIKNTESAGGFQPGIAIMADGEPIVVGQIPNLPKPNSDSAGVLAKIIQEAESQDTGRIQLASAQSDQSLIPEKLLVSDHTEAASDKVVSSGANPKREQPELATNLGASDTAATPTGTIFKPSLAIIPVDRANPPPIDSVAAAQAADVPIKLAIVEPVAKAADKPLDTGEGAQLQAALGVSKPDAAKNAKQPFADPSKGDAANAGQQTANLGGLITEQTALAEQSATPQHAASSNHRSFFYKSINFIRDPHKWFAWASIHHHNQHQKKTVQPDNGTSQPINFNQPTNIAAIGGDIAIDFAPKSAGIVGGNDILVRLTDGGYAKSHAGLSTRDMACMTLAQKQASGYLPTKSGKSGSFLGQFRNQGPTDSFYRPAGLSTLDTEPVIISADANCPNIVLLDHPFANDNATALSATAKIKIAFQNIASDLTHRKLAQAKVRYLIAALPDAINHDAAGTFDIVTANLGIIKKIYAQGYAEQQQRKLLGLFVSHASNMKDYLEASRELTKIATLTTSRSALGKAARRTLAKLASPNPEALSAAA